MDFYLIKEQYFMSHPNFVNMLDPYDNKKQANRMYLCIKFVVNGNDVYVPFRSKIKPALRKFGRIGHELPSNQRPDAGLDYRHILLVDDPTYLVPVLDNHFPRNQLNKLAHDYDKINKEVETYINGFIRAAKRNDIEKTPLYRESSLINFIDILLS